MRMREPGINAPGPRRRHRVRFRAEARTMGLLSWMRKPMIVELAGATDSGKGRSHNEDAFGIDAVHRCAVIADGMGGLARGEVASRLVVDSVLAAIGQGERVASALSHAHRAIQALGAAPNGERMGATAVAVSFGGRHAQITWMGDSRAYLFRDGKLEQLTKDHSFVQELVDAGAITQAEAEKHPNRNVVTRAVGIADAEARAPAQVRVEVRTGDRILLCTDGLHGYLPSEKIVDELRNGASNSQVPHRLIERTLAESEAGDNITVICAQVQG
jgi:serine/threonine protein phosphatase PrpC